MSLQQYKSVSVKSINNIKKYLEESKNKKAFKILDKLIKRNPSNDETWLYLGITKRRLGDLNGAIECFQKASNINISMLEAWGLLTITLIDQGNIKMAQQIIEKAHYLNPYNANIHFFSKNLVRIYKKFGPFF
ncbi:MAG: tetratricopeptide repeat protein [Promethearchaeota archaeon]